MLKLSCRLLLLVLFIGPVLAQNANTTTPASQIATAQRHLAEAQQTAAHSAEKARILREKADELKKLQAAAEINALEKEKAAAVARAATTPDASAQEEAARLARAVETTRASEAAVAEREATDAQNKARTETARVKMLDGELEKVQAALKSHVALGNSEIYGQSLAALTMLFVIAVLLENAFALLFNWRVFLAYVSLGGMKTVIMVLVSLVVVCAFNVDILASLISAYKTQAGSDPVDSFFVSKFITALILAGGSAGVHNIMAALGYRDARRTDEVMPKPPRNEAWVAVHVTPGDSSEAARVQIRDLGPVTATSPAPIAGMIGFRRPSLLSILFRNPNRYPANGGHAVKPGQVYEITVANHNAKGTVVKDADGHIVTVGAPPSTYVFAAGAVVDFYP